MALAALCVARKNLFDFEVMGFARFAIEASTVRQDQPTPQCLVDTIEPPLLNPITLCPQMFESGGGGEQVMSMQRKRGESVSMQ